MNQTIMTGNLTADIETRQVGEQHLSKFTLACNEGERVVFIPVEAWNMAHLPDCLAKGAKVLVSGSLKQNNWETEDGEKRSRIVLTAYKVEFLDPAPEKPSVRSDRPKGKNDACSRAA
ncbi:single-stranded DNA-binding protein [Coraliomargarita sinensis]|uniref:Single-stranded DNA-binding protein n=1 Tax=Coraliomargarita sinensis TaxID=2174842 RepID=A0A317ZLY7_9BACT|nr:single-stranded DNA-binding protein [Coraliomargarita sinensis]PXA04938.1 single-stranded DNA-binding protein [Coraliomargarita sinensis]